MVPFAGPTTHAVECEELALGDCSGIIAPDIDEFRAQPAINARTSMSQTGPVLCAPKRHRLSSQGRSKRGNDVPRLPISSYQSARKRDQRRSRLRPPACPHHHSGFGARVEAQNDKSEQQPLTAEHWDLTLSTDSTTISAVAMAIRHLF